MDSDLRPSHRSAAAGGFVAAGLVVIVVGVTLGFAIKDRCSRIDWSSGKQYSQACYNDVYPLYFRGDFDGEQFTPIRDGGFPYLSANFEYPAGTGAYVGAVGVVTRGLARGDADAGLFFRVNALGLFAAGVIAGALVLLMAQNRRRVMYFALAPAMLIFGFLNWDLLALGFAAGGLYAFSRRRDSWAGALLGIGAATKLFPAFLIPGLLLARWRETGRIETKLIAWPVATFAAVNLPFLIADPGRWWIPWGFQSTRFPNFETSWYFLYRHLGEGSGTGFWWSTYPKLTGVVSGLLFLGLLALLLWRESKRERIRPYALGLGALVLFLLTAKVFSPQFSLWLLPFFVLLRIPWQTFAAVAAADVLVWAAVAKFFLASSGFEPGDAGLRLTLLEGAVLLRYAALGWLLWRSRNAEELVREVPPQSGAPAGIAAAPAAFRATPDPGL